MSPVSKLLATATAGALLSTACAAGGPTTAARVAPDSIGTAHYITAEDGTRLAADVYLPAGEAGETFPALLSLTRYIRGTVDPETGEPNVTLSPLDRHLLAHGYALVKVDARGSGASFGTRPAEYGRQEVRDGRDVVEWVVAQDWSDGNVGAYGTSYTGTTAELLAAVEHPAVKAVIPGWSDFDPYVSPARPYGMVPTFLELWSDLVGAMDRNDTAALGAAIRPVDEDTDGSLLAAALAEHAANPVVLEAALGAEFRDDRFGGGDGWGDTGPIAWVREIERSGVPMLVPVSWLDAGTAEGALLRFRHLDNPQKLLILASTHGGGYHASPFTVGTEPLPPQPSVEEQFELRRRFLDHHLKGEDNGVEAWPAIRYFNLGEEAYHESETWPPPGRVARTWHLDGEGTLTRAGSADGGGGAVAAGADRYVVDRGVTTGTNNRWMAQLGQPILRLDDRAAMDARMLTYTTAPLAEDVQIAGWPVVTLRLATDREDGAVLVYLEDVGPDGRSRYITEGGLRLLHRKTVANPYFDDELPYRSFARADAAPMRPGVAEEVTLTLWPIAALFREGHRIRIAIAGADADTFDPVPAEGEPPTLTVHRGGTDGSRLVLPVVEGGLR